MPFIGQANANGQRRYAAATAAHEQALTATAAGPVLTRPLRTLGMGRLTALVVQNTGGVAQASIEIITAAGDEALDGSWRALPPFATVAGGSALEEHNAIVSRWARVVIQAVDASTYTVILMAAA